MKTLFWIALPALFMYVLWVYYLAVMNLYRVHRVTPLTGFPLMLGYAVFIPGIALDIIGNLVIMTVILAEMPREWKVTDRVIRHLYGSTGYRYRVAKWFCDHLLNPYDPSGCHCKRKENT